jgi:hypothetical protein
MYPLNGFANSGKRAAVIYSDGAYIESPNIITSLYYRIHYIITQLYYRMPILLEIILFRLYYFTILSDAILDLLFRRYIIGALLTDLFSDSI